MLNGGPSAQTHGTRNARVGRLRQKEDVYLLAVVLPDLNVLRVVKATTTPCCGNRDAIVEQNEAGAAQNFCDAGRILSGSTRRVDDEVEILTISRLAEARFP